VLTARVKVGSSITNAETVIMDAEPICIACNVTRTLTSVIPVRNRHEMQSFECPSCANVFRFVVRRKRRPLTDEISERLAPMAASQALSSPGGSHSDYTLLNA
jgi:hypothetical protein